MIQVFSTIQVFYPSRYQRHTTRMRSKGLQRTMEQINLCMVKVMFTQREPSASRVLIMWVFNLARKAYFPLRLL